ncbi:uncharacterized protein METZ01_LOCUS207610 [marine metagenome]|uniref:DUF3499 domain-containing protein n=1 Tax=marine metagenome TaxID=408172 RepID=A0A382EVD8_9ZZZZ
MRSACLGTAEVLVVMDVAELTFTVHDLDEVDGPGAVVLCATHVERLRAPVGWELIDARGTGSVIPLPERPMTVNEAADEVLRPVADVEPIRPDASVHPLTVARVAAETVDMGTGTEDPVPDSVETPLLARAFLGVNRHPAATPAGSSGAVDEDLIVEDDPFAGHQWDQSDERDVETESDPQMTGQLTFGSDPVA